MSQNQQPTDYMISTRTAIFVLYPVYIKSNGCWFNIIPLGAQTKVALLVTLIWVTASHLLNKNSGTALISLALKAVKRIMFFENWRGILRGMLYNVRSIEFFIQGEKLSKHMDELSLGFFWNGFNHYFFRMAFVATIAVPKVMRSFYELTNGFLPPAGSGQSIVAVQ